jgi:hypothetical protein
MTGRRPEGVAERTSAWSGDHCRRRRCRLGTRHTASGPGTPSWWWAAATIRRARRTPAVCCPPSLRSAMEPCSNPLASTWRRIADAPVPLGSSGGVEAAWGTVVGGVLYLLVPGFELAPGAGRDSPSPPPAFLAYSPTDDRWHELALPPGNPTLLALVAAGDKVVGYLRTQEVVGADPVPDASSIQPDVVYDPASRTWSELPADPLFPSFGRSMVWTGRELVLLGNEVTPRPGSERPSVVRAAALDLATGEWRRLPDSEVLGYAPTWFWTGKRIVNPSLGSVDGGRVNNWGRSYSFGGVLDPLTGQWSPLPEPPPRPGPRSRTATARLDRRPGRRRSHRGGHPGRRPEPGHRDLDTPAAPGRRSRPAPDNRVGG